MVFVSLCHCIRDRQSSGSSPGSDSFQKSRDGARVHSSAPLLAHAPSEQAFAPRRLRGVSACFPAAHLSDGLVPPGVYHWQLRYPLIRLAVDLIPCPVVAAGKVKRFYMLWVSGPLGAWFSEEPVPVAEDPFFGSSPSRFTRMIRSNIGRSLSAMAS